MADAVSASPSRLPERSTWPALLRPFSVGLRRTLIETIAGYAVLVGLASRVDPHYRLTGAGAILSVLALAWGVLWPAWRLRRASGRSWWVRLGKGAGRTLLCGLVLLAATSALSVVLWPSVRELARTQPQLTGGSSAASLLLFFCARLIAVVTATIRRHARRRLRWQLTFSHLAVIILTFAGMAAFGSFIGLKLFLTVARPNSAAAATAMAATVRLTATSNGLDRGRVQALLGEIEAGHILLHGAPFLNSSPPLRVLVLSPDGTVLAAAMQQQADSVYHISRAAEPLPAHVWPQLRRSVMAGRAGTVTIAATTHVGGLNVPTQLQLGAAPIMDAARRLRGVAIVEGPDVTNLTPAQFVANALEIFGVAALLLAITTALPLLALSSLFGYVLAHSLTRRLEAVSRVTTAIAAGDLTQRAPVNARNEVGRLAEDVNRMAAHLERTMSELQHARTQAVDALRNRQELVASISHELRTPLAIVRAHLDTLAMRQAAAANGDAAWEPEVAVPATTLHALQNETERLAALVDDLFALSRAETGALQVQHDRVDVAALVDEVAALMRPLAQREGMIALSVDAPPGLPPALADAGRLRQILENLVRNAVRHTPDGGIIVLSVAVDGPWIAISVVDTGEGIPPEHLPHIFDRFYRVDQARTRSSGGAGLGLAIVREFVELMGGHVTVESTPGEGSCFRVLLPSAAPAPDAARPVVDAAQV